MDLAGLVTVLFVIIKDAICVLASETTTPTSCQSPLGLAYDSISPLAGVIFTASEGDAKAARLNGPAAWTLTNISSDSYLQIRLPRPLIITGIETQGSPVEESWIVSLYIQFSQDCHTYVNHSKSYWANVDDKTTLTHLFHNVSIARCVRIFPTEFAGNSSALRIEMLGCEVAFCRHRLNVTPVTSFSGADAWTGIVTRLQSESIMTSLTVSLSTSEEQGGAELKIEYSRTCSEFVILEDGDISRITHKRRKFILAFPKSRSCPATRPRRKKHRRPFIIFDSNSDIATSDCTEKSHVVEQSFADLEKQTIEISLVNPVRAQCLRVTASRDATVNNVFVTGCSVTASHGPLSGCGRSRSIHRTRRKRVVGGQLVLPGEWPWLVSLHFLKWHQFTNTSGLPHLCGASLIDRRWILSAAHCFDSSVAEGLDQAANWRVAIGEHDQSGADGTEQFNEIDKIIKHPYYPVDPGPILFDIALIKLKEPVVLSDYVNTICLDTEGDFPSGSLCAVAGWGQPTVDSPGTKLPFKTMIPIQDSEECKNLYDALPFDHPTKSAVRIDDSVFCSVSSEGGKDACQGDSGGPFSCEKDGVWYQTGIVSLGYGCGNVEYPGIYTRISYFADWIQENMANN